MKKGIAGLLVLAALALFGCNNHFHDLIPPNGNRIISFSVEGQMERAEITDDTVTVMVNNESPVYSLIPHIEISPKATLLPMTYDYLDAAFPNMDILKERTAVYETQDITEYVIDLIKRTPDFNVPAFDKPIDFTGPVSFLVVSGQGNIRQYTVYVIMDTGEPRLLGLGFSKNDNPELMRDAFTFVYESAKAVQASMLYPAEMELSYALIPSFTILGERLEIDGVEVRSRVDAVQFNKALGTQGKTLTVWRNGISMDYTLTAGFSADSDSNRSIIDFRFNQKDNPQIAMTAVGSIYDSNHLGTINVQVFYSGARPSILTPAFLSPGTVSVAGVTQISGVSSHDFSQTQEYRVVSRNNQYTRIYTVRVEFIDIASALKITSFKFSSGLNPELVQDTEAQISESAGLIMLTARYGGSYAPEMLIPEFRATGIVTVLGSVQTSGFSGQDFTRQIKYTVVNADNPLLERDYWVQVSFIRDTSSDASINSFSFHPNENPGIADEISGRIDHNMGTITVFAPIGSGITGRTMMPRFRAAGQVQVNGEVQISGISGGHFHVPVVYEAVSANGVNRKRYTVTVRELQSTIFVKHDAFGMGDGANWTDAFRNLKDACEAAAQFPADVPKEIWIAAGTYKPSTVGNAEEYLLLAANTSYIGGFGGWETSKNQRNITANKVVISGDLGGGQYSRYLFRSFNNNFDDDDYYTPAAINGDLSFENLDLTSARAGVYLATGCSGNIEINNVNMQSITANYGFYFSRCSGDIKIDNVNIQNISGSYSYGFYFSSCFGDININSVNMQNISSYGIYMSGGSGRREFSRVTGNRVNGAYAVYVSGGVGSVTMADGNFDTGGGVYVSASGSAIRVSRTTLRNVSGENALFTSGGNTVLENITVNSVPNGRGISIYSSGTAQVLSGDIRNTSGSNAGAGIYLDSSGNGTISACYIQNTRAISSNGSSYGGGGICLSGSGSKTVSGTTIADVQAYMGGGIYSSYDSGNLTISNTTIRNATATTNETYSGGGGGLYYISSSRLTINNNSRFENCRSDGSYGAILATAASSVTITNTNFINCIAWRLYKIMYLSDNSTVRNCLFEHNSSIYTYSDPNERRERGSFFHRNGTFEDCTFTNLDSNERRPNYLFSSYTQLDSNLGYDYVGDDGDLTLRNCTFNIGRETAGICALYTGWTTSGTYVRNRLYMDGVTISSALWAEPMVIWLVGGDYYYDETIYRFKLNNVHSFAGGTGELLDLAALSGTGTFIHGFFAKITIVD